MTTIQRMETGKRMSRIVIHNDTVYLCGQVAGDASEGTSYRHAQCLTK